MSVPVMWRAVAKSEDVWPLGIGADDVGPSCCIAMHRRNILHRVVGPAHEEAAQAGNAVGDVGNIVGMCWISRPT